MGAGYNPSVDYGQNAGKTNRAQNRYANLQNEYQRAVLGDPTARNQDAIRQSMFKTSAFLGAIRESAKWIVQEQKSNLDAIKGLNELAKV